MYNGCLFSLIAPRDSEVRRILRTLLLNLNRSIRPRFARGRCTDLQTETVYGILSRCGRSGSIGLGNLRG